MDPVRLWRRNFLRGTQPMWVDEEPKHPAYFQDFVAVRCHEYDALVAKCDLFDEINAERTDLLRAKFLRPDFNAVEALDAAIARDDAVEEAARALCDAIGDTMPNNAWGWNLVNKRDNLRAALAEAARPAPVAPSRGGEAVAWGVADCDGKIVDADVYRDRCEAWVGSTSPGAPFRVVALVPKEAP